MNIFYMKQKRVRESKLAERKRDFSVAGKRVRAWVINLTVGQVIYEG